MIVNKIARRSKFILIIIKVTFNNNKYEINNKLFIFVYNECLLLFNNIDIIIIIMIKLNSNYVSLLLCYATTYILLLLLIFLHINNVIN